LGESHRGKHDQNEDSKSCRARAQGDSLHSRSEALCGSRRRCGCLGHRGNAGEGCEGCAESHQEEGRKAYGYQEEKKAAKKKVAKKKAAKKKVAKKGSRKVSANTRGAVAAARSKAAS
jgi:hypothetical protein